MRGRLPLCVAAVLLGACSASPVVTVGPPADGSAPTGESSTTTAETTAAGPAAPVEWGECEPSDDYDVAGWECGTVEVPLDYDGSVEPHHHHRPDPRSGHRRVDAHRLALREPRAARAARGSRPSTTWSTSSRRTSRPASTSSGSILAASGASTAVDCVDDKAKDAEADLDPTPDTPAEVTAHRRPPGRVVPGLRRRPRATSCRTSAPSNAARDLDRLREAVGDEGLTYLGFSYGTTLGATYAGLFPDKARALVLDGATDPASGLSTDDEQSSGWYGDQDFDGAFSRFDDGLPGRHRVCGAAGTPRPCSSRCGPSVEKAPIPAAAVQSEDGQAAHVRPARDRRRLGLVRRRVLAVPGRRPQGRGRR